MTPEKEAELRRRIDEARKVEEDAYLAGVRKLVEAVGRKYAPPSLDEYALKSDLDWALRYSDSRAADEHRAGCREVEKEFEALEKHAGRLGNLTPQHAERLSEISEWARRERESWAKYRVGYVAITRPLSFMIGYHLVPIFEKHFQRMAGASRDQSGNVGGPFVRFALYVLNEYSPDQDKRPVAAGSVESALRDAKKHVIAGTESGWKCATRPPRRS